MNQKKKQKKKQKVEQEVEQEVEGRVKGGKTKERTYGKADEWSPLREKKGGFLSCVCRAVKPKE